MSPQQMMRSFVGRHKWRYLASFLAIALAEYMQVQIPNVIGEFINRFKLGVNAAGVMHYALLLVAIAAVYVVSFGLGQFQVGRLGRTMEYDLRQRLFEHWETLSSRYFQQHSVGDLLSHALNDVPAVREALSGGINQIVQALFLFVATLYMTFRKIDLDLTLVSLIPILFIPIVIVVLGPRIRTRSRQVQEALSTMSELAEESFQAIRLIKATSNEPIEIERFTLTVDDIVSRQMDLVQLNTLFQAVLPLLSGFSFVIALIYGGSLVIHGQISLGAFVAFTVYLSMLIQPLMQFGFVINTFQNASASLIRIQVLLAVEPDITDPPAPVVRHWRGEIAVDHLTFTYPGATRPALSDITLRVPHGSTLGIVGKTGSGKTTLLNLLLRDYNPPPGALRIDGVDVRDMRLADLRELIAYVPQDGFLFSTTIGNNIAFSQPHVVPEAVERAARQSRIYDTIQSLPQGIHTEVGERGIMLSGGQRQRTAIARALIKTQARILVLDDSLSAVDTRTETEILNVLREVRRQKTTIIAAHRLSALRDADYIVVLDQGAIVEEGQHEDLLKQNGLYAQLYRIQSGGEPQHA